MERYFFRLLVMGLQDPLMVFKWLFISPHDEWRLKLLFLLDFLVSLAISAAIGVYFRKAWLALLCGMIASTLFAYPLINLYFMARPVIDPKMTQGLEMGLLLVPLAAASSFWLTGGSAWLVAAIRLRTIRRKQQEVEDAIHAEIQAPHR